MSLEACIVYAKTSADRHAWDADELSITSQVNVILTALLRRVTSAGEAKQMLVEEKEVLI